jgi:hypothetical protein
LGAQRRLWSPSRRGALVAVLHFDHLFHAHRRDANGYFAVRDPRTVEDRIDVLFAHLHALRRPLGFPSVTLEELDFGQHSMRLRPGGETATEADAR